MFRPTICPSWQSNAPPSSRAIDDVPPSVLAVLLLVEERFVDRVGVARQNNFLVDRLVAGWF